MKIYDKHFAKVRKEVLTFTAKAVTLSELKSNYPIIILTDDIEGVETKLTYRYFTDDDFMIEVLRDGVIEFCFNFLYSDIEEERQRLLNKPDWPEDLRWKYRALDSDGWWCFYKSEPECNGTNWVSSDKLWLRLRLKC